MAIERWRPFGTLMDRDPFRDIQHEMNRVFDRFLGRHRSPFASCPVETAQAVCGSNPAPHRIKTREPGCWAITRRASRLISVL
jgi:hypothetical protein